MTDLAWGAVAVLLVGWGVLAYEWWGLPRRRRRVLLNFTTPDLAAVEGVLVSRRGRWLVLADAWRLQDGRPPTRIDGEALIDRATILFMQACEPLPRGQVPPAAPASDDRRRRLSAADDDGAARGLI